MPEKKTRDGALQRLKRYLSAYSGGEEPILRSLGQRPYLELSADRQLLIEGCGGILDYEEDRLALSAGRLLFLSSFRSSSSPSHIPPICFTGS